MSQLETSTVETPDVETLDEVSSEALYEVS